MMNSTRCFRPAGLPGAALLAGAALALAACSPTVKMEPPDEPITINLNINIQHEIRVQVEEELDEIFAPDSGLF